MKKIRLHKCYITSCLPPLSVRCFPSSLDGVWSRKGEDDRDGGIDGDEEVVRRGGIDGGGVDMQEGRRGSAIVVSGGRRGCARSGSPRVATSSGA